MRLNRLSRRCAPLKGASAVHAATEFPTTRQPALATRQPLNHRLRKVLFVSHAASSRMKLPAQSRSWGLRDELALTLPRSLLANGVAAP
jgi:hypothetical protein